MSTSSIIIFSNCCNLSTPAPPTRGAQNIGTSLWRRGSRPAHTVQGCSAFRWLQIKFSCLAEQVAIITFNFQGPFSNSPDFARDFVCPLGSAMNPVKKCEVWWIPTSIKGARSWSQEVGAFCSDLLRNGNGRDRHKSYHANSTKSVPLVNVPLHPFKFIRLRNKWDHGKSNGFANNSRYNSDFDFRPNISNSISIVTWLWHLSVHL